MRSEKWRCQVPAKSATPMARDSPLCELFTEFIATPIKGWFGGEVSMETAYNPSRPPTKPSDGATVGRAAIVCQQEESEPGLSSSLFAESQSAPSGTLVDPPSPSGTGSPAAHAHTTARVLPSEMNLNFKFNAPLRQVQRLNSISVPSPGFAASPT